MNVENSACLSCTSCSSSTEIKPDPSRSTWRRSPSSNSGSPRNAPAPICSSSTISRSSTPTVALDIAPYCASDDAPASEVRYWSTARRSAKSTSGSFWSSLNLNTSASTLAWVSFNPSTRASSKGPKLEIVARSWAPLLPVRLRYSTGRAAPCHAQPVSVARCVMRSFASPAAPIPERSPFKSARNTGTPAAENCSAISCRDFVLPVPVAPAISPCRFAIASGSRTSGSAAHSPPCTTAPSVIAEPPAGNAARASARTFASINASALELVDLAPALVHEVVVALHDGLELLQVGLLLALARHHLLERFDARHLHLGDHRPVSLGAHVGHDLHLPHAHLLVQLGHGEELLDQRTHLAGLAVHDVADEQHDGSSWGSGWTVQALRSGEPRLASRAGQARF